MSATPPSNRLLTEFTPTRGVVIAWTGVGTGAWLVAIFVFGAISAAGNGRSDIAVGTADGQSVILAAALVLTLVGGVIVVHEMIHAAVIRHYGGDVSFGMGVAQFVMPYAYVTTTRRLTRNGFVAVALAPLVVITLVGVPLMVALDAVLLAIPLSVNVAGAVGDLWMTGILLRYPSHVVVEDSAAGLRIYGTVDDVPLPPTRVGTFATRTALGTGVGFGLVFLALLSAPVLLAVLGVESLTVGVADSPWSVFSFERTADGGFSAGTNPLGVLAVSVLVGFGYAFLTTPRARRVESANP